MIYAAAAAAARVTRARTRGWDIINRSSREQWRGGPSKSFLEIAARDRETVPARPDRRVWAQKAFSTRGDESIYGARGASLDVQVFGRFVEKKKVLRFRPSSTDLVDHVWKALCFSRSWKQEGNITVWYRHQLEISYHNYFKN